MSQLNMQSYQLNMQRYNNGNEPWTDQQALVAYMTLAPS